MALTVKKVDFSSLNYPDVSDILQSVASEYSMDLERVKAAYDSIRNAGEYTEIPAVMMDHAYEHITGAEAEFSEPEKSVFIDRILKTRIARLIQARYPETKDYSIDKYWVHLSGRRKRATDKQRGIDDNN